MSNISLTYLSQNDRFYKVETAKGEKLQLLKHRNGDKVLDMPSRSAEFRTPFFHLVVAFLGLPLGGALTVVAALVAVWKVYQIAKLEPAKNSPVRARALSFLATGSLLLAVGVPLTVVSLMHLIFS